MSVSVNRRVLGYKNISTQAVDYYVDASIGSDLNDGGSIATPFKTIGKAVSLVPNFLNHFYTIYVKPGVYNESITTITEMVSASGRLEIRGTDWTRATLATGANTGTVASGVMATGVYTVTAAGWTVDDLKGCHIRATSGTGTATYFPIASNTADTFTCPVFIATYRDYLIGQTFEIVKPAATIVGTSLDGGAVNIANGRTRYLNLTIQNGVSPYAVLVTNAATAYLQYCAIESTSDVNPAVSALSDGAGMTHTLSACFIKAAYAGVLINNCTPLVTVISSSNTGAKVGYGMHALSPNALLYAFIQGFERGWTTSELTLQGGVSFNYVRIRDCGYGIYFDSGVYSMTCASLNPAGVVVSNIDYDGIYVDKTASLNGYEGLNGGFSIEIAYCGRDAISFSGGHCSLYIDRYSNIHDNTRFGVNMRANDFSTHSNVQLSASATFANNGGDLSLDGSTSMTFAELKATPPNPIVVDNINFLRLATF